MMRVLRGFWAGGDLGAGAVFRGLDGDAFFRATTSGVEFAGFSSDLHKALGASAPSYFAGPPVQQITEPPDIPGNVTTPYALTLGGSETGVIGSLGDQDWFRVELIAGQTYVFTMTGSGSPALQDTYLALHNSVGTLIAIDDDGSSTPGSTDSLLRFTATTSGTYYIAARAWIPEDGELPPGYTATGGYAISMNSGAPQDPLDTIDLGFAMPTVIDVYFAPSGYTNPFGDTASRNWTASEISAAMAALATYSAVTPIVFNQTNSSANAEFILILANLDAGVLGYFGNSGGVGHGAFAPTGTGWTTFGLQPGGLGFVTLIHEFGHGLGLAHPHDNGGVSEIMQGVTGPFNSYGTFLMNQGVFTTLTYNDGWPLAPWGANGSTTTGSQATPGPLDIALLQQRYGVNPNTGAGDTTYNLLSFDSAYRAIWDVNGIDTISFNGALAAVIDLRAATLLNEIGGGGFVSYVYGVDGGFTIANGVMIENATGGSGADTLIGNAAANVLNGGAGADSMSGGLGDDSYVVDNAGDVVIEASSGGVDSVSASISYTLLNNVENLTLTGSANLNAGGNGDANTINGNSGANAIDGAAGNDVLFGFGGNDTLIGGLGADQMAGGQGDDVHYVDSNFDVVTELSGQGYDWIFTSVSLNLPANIEGQVLLEAAGQINAGGNAGDNYIQGNSFANGLDGGPGSDTLVGGGGNDTLFGGGQDNLFGGTGDDVYRVDNPGTNITELAGEGFDWIFTTTSFTMQANVEGMVLEEAGGAINAAGNAENNYIQGNTFSNGIDGGAGADTLVGFGGDDTFVFQAGQANGDVINDFIGNSAAVGDRLIFQGYGTAAQGATLTQINATQWSINSADGLIHDIITLANGANIDPSDYLFI